MLRRRLTYSRFVGLDLAIKLLVSVDNRGKAPGNCIASALSMWHRVLYEDGSKSLAVHLYRTKIPRSYGKFQLKSP